MISVEAVGVLSVCVYQDIPPTSPALVERFRGVKRQGPDYFQRILRELRQAGFVGLKKEVIGNDIRTACWVTDEGKQYLLELDFPAPQSEITETGISTPLLQQNELINTNSIASLTSKEYTWEDPRVNESEEPKVGYDFFEKTSSDERLEEIAKDQERRNKKYQEAKEEKQSKRLVGRNNKPQLAWTPSDTCYEFADRLLQHWHIKPWVLKETKFIVALADHRRRYDTNGEIEVKMMDLFFSTFDFQTQNDPEYLSRIFLNMFPRLAEQSKGMVRTDEELEDAQEQARKSQEWLYE